MITYSYIEERYCIYCKRNVGIEYTHMSSGDTIKRCLNKFCANETEPELCFYNTNTPAL